MGEHVAMTFSPLFFVYTYLFVLIMDLPIGGSTSQGKPSGSISRRGRGSEEACIQCYRQGPDRKRL